MEYDPLNQTVYIINGTAPYYITGINLAYKKIASQLALPTSPELNAFNPNDGLIYQVTTDDDKNVGAGMIVYGPVANAIKTTYLTPNCVGHVGGKRNVAGHRADDASRPAYTFDFGSDRV